MGKIELLFVWIKEYKNLKEVGFNLSNEFNIEYNPTDCQLYFSKTEKLVQDYFANNISNLKVLVGANGTGKSTFAQFILRYFVEGLQEREIPAIVIAKAGDEIILYSPSEIQVKNLDKIDGIEKVTDWHATCVSQLHYVFYTPVFDPFYLDKQDLTRNDEDFQGVYNLSTSNRLEKDWEHFNNSSGTLPYQEMKRAHLRMDFNRQVSYIASFYKNDLPFKIPHFLQLRLNLEVEESLLNNSEGQTNEILSNYIAKFQSVVQILKNAEQFQTLFELNFIRAALGNFLIDYFINNSSLNLVQYLPQVSQEITKSLLSGLKGNDVDANYSRFCIAISKIIPDQYSFVHAKLQQFRTDLRELGKFFCGNSTNKGFYATIDITLLIESDREELLQAVGRYYGNMGISGYFDLYFSHESEILTNLSSGELSFLTMYSRLYWLKYQKVMKESLPKNIFLILDEVEQNLHPSWQAKFIKNLNSFISSAFGDYHVQIILTTHSPFILSDLPPYCCLYLEEKNGRVVSSSGLSEHGSTLGANIHELLSDSFFMHDGLVGEYAKDKINLILKKLHTKKKLIKKDIKEIEGIIQIIGEHYIKEKIRQLYEWKLIEDKKIKRRK